MTAAVFSLRQVAIAAGIRYIIARKYVAQGSIKAERTGRGYYRVSKQEMQRVVKRFRR